MPSKLMPIWVVGYLTWILYQPHNHKRWNECYFTPTNFSGACGCTSGDPWPFSEQKYCEFSNLIFEGKQECFLIAVPNSRWQNCVQAIYINFGLASPKQVKYSYKNKKGLKPFVPAVHASIRVSNQLWRKLVKDWVETFFGQEVGLVKIPLTWALLLSTSQNFSYTSIPKKRKKWTNQNQYLLIEVLTWNLHLNLPSSSIILLIITCRGTGLRWPVTLK